MLVEERYITKGITKEKVGTCLLLTPITKEDYEILKPGSKMLPIIEKMTGCKFSGYIKDINAPVAKLVETHQT